MNQLGIAVAGGGPGGLAAALLPGRDYRRLRLSERLERRRVQPDRD